MSLTTLKTTALNNVVAKAVNAGLTVVAAAGNYNKDAEYYSPASEPLVLTIASIAVTDTKAGNSNWGQCMVSPIRPTFLLQFGKPSANGNKNRCRSLRPRRGHHQRLVRARQHRHKDHQRNLHGHSPRCGSRPDPHRKGPRKIQQPRCDSKDYHRPCPKELEGSTPCAPRNDHASWLQWALTTSRVAWVHRPDVLLFFLSFFLSFLFGNLFGGLGLGNWVRNQEIFVM